MVVCDLSLDLINHNKLSGLQKSVWGSLGSGCPHHGSHRFSHKWALKTCTGGVNSIIELAKFWDPFQSPLNQLLWANGRWANGSVQFNNVFCSLPLPLQKQQGLSQGSWEGIKCYLFPHPTLWYLAKKCFSSVATFRSLGLGPFWHTVPPKHTN